MEVDLAIVGGGPAGLTAGLYAARRALRTIILSKDLGGQAATTPDIENYPGIDFTDGLNLMMQFQEQAIKHGAEFVAAEVQHIAPQENGFVLTTSVGEYEARAVILACGSTPRDMGVPGEDELKGRGVSSCVTCDGPLYKNKKVVVVGGGHSALEAAGFLSKIAAEVHIIHQRKTFLAAPELIKQITGDKKVTAHLETKVVAVLGEDRVAAISLETKEGPLSIAVDGVFVELGHITKTDWLAGLVERDRVGHVIVDRFGQTSCPGIFAAGDITDADFKQVVISAGDGAKAALKACQYIEHQSDRPIVPDWGFIKEE